MVTDQPQEQLKPDINDMLPSDLINEDENVIFAIKPSLWTIIFLSFRTTVIASILTALTLWLGPMMHLGRLSTYIVEACGAAILTRFGFAVLQWVSRSYVLTDRRIIRIRGVFTIDIFQCALPKVQNTFLVLTLPQRILQLGNIEFTTAGTGSVEAIWRHVKHPLNIHKQLINAMNTAANQPQRSNPPPKPKSSPEGNPISA
ncbi:MAG: PH domain-containing protein [Planctomycetes bacterium]|nr:PH domain-containing protein [Planctomycetota bacterium]